MDKYAKRNRIIRYLVEEADSPFIQAMYQLVKAQKQEVPIVLQGKKEVIRLDAPKHRMPKNDQAP